jgi:Phosphoglycerol transferase and related proteins, alkaline phosphatase superfamily
MSPVFGGNTANAEFEFLSGHPANAGDRGIVFETQLRNKIPALPAVLASFGYDTIVMHPYFASFWNRVNAYRRLGFNRYYSAGDFVMNDLNHWTLSDDSFLRQAAAKLKKTADKRPSFVYLLTLSGHWPFALNEQKRPPVITGSSNNELLLRYVNMVYYNSAAAAGFVRYVFQKDPDTLMIILGDHLPLLGDNFQAYVEAGVLAPRSSGFDAPMYRFYTGTPLMVIDGKNGPKKLGTVAMYELPGIILRLLKAPPDAAMTVFQPPEGLHIRPLEGMSLVITAEGRERLCRDTEPRCPRRYSPAMAKPGNDNRPGYS